ncbi:hypothetical protein HYH03_018750 [Edaphochlamys debaryana]|uniref:Uncharacterized protein n=1 Tax=Edaphochlamys debaryana TaxID=47281 RepID=A0A836BP70_9CHLO|nr:hypothetical protein HYH03_018750 [Edaphochlamys debaryana]|eukprot:KAG2482308.1 hypothetical protein HYH03_018750 [Edaphochlamys debaryana]
MAPASPPPKAGAASAAQVPAASGQNVQAAPFGLTLRRSSGGGLTAALAAAQQALGAPVAALAALAAAPTARPTPQPSTPSPSPPVRETPTGRASEAGAGSTVAGRRHQ